MIYTSLLLVLLIFKILDLGTRKLTVGTYYSYMNSNKHYRRRYVITVTSALLFFWFLYATIIMGLRGDFSADYNSYTKWFYRINNISDISFWEYFGLHNVFSEYVETGYAIINRIVGHFTSNSIWLFVVCAIVICLPVFLLFRKSAVPWLAALLWISIGPYLEGFNTMRGAMAASILIFSLKYLQERKLIKYVIVVLIATTFHSIAIIMLIAYCLPLIKPSKKSVFIILIIAVIVSASGEILAIRFNDVFHAAPSDAEALSLLYRYSSSGASLLVPLLIEIMSFYIFFNEVENGKIDLEDTCIRMMFNGNLIWILFQLLTIFTGYSTRLAMLFFYYPCIFIPFLVKRERKYKTIYILITILAVSWYLINTFIRYPPYYFAI